MTPKLPREARGVLKAARRADKRDSRFVEAIWVLYECEWQELARVGPKPGRGIDPGAAEHIVDELVRAVRTQDEAGGLTPEARQIVQALVFWVHDHTRVDPPIAAQHRRAHVKAGAKTQPPETRLAIRMAKHLSGEKRAVLPSASLRRSFGDRSLRSAQGTEIERSLSGWQGLERKTACKLAALATSLYLPESMHLRWTTLLDKLKRPARKRTR